MMSMNYVVHRNRCDAIMRNRIHAFYDAGNSGVWSPLQLKSNRTYFQFSTSHLGSLGICYCVWSSSRGMTNGVSPTPKFARRPPLRSHECLTQSRDLHYRGNGELRTRGLPSTSPHAMDPNDDQEVEQALEYLDPLPSPSGAWG